MHTFIPMDYKHFKVSFGCHGSHSFLWALNVQARGGRVRDANSHSGGGGTRAAELPPA